MEQNKWVQVDNLANIFLSCCSRRNSRTIRFSCTLREKVDPVALQTALDNTVDERDQFQVRIRRGIFWHYIEKTDYRVRVKEEDGKICPLLYDPQNKSPLHYRVTWYDKRINFEIFHAISDGTGAAEFLNNLVLNYLKIVHPGEISSEELLGSANSDELGEDSYKKFYDDKGTPPDERENAYHIKGLKNPYDQLQFFDVIMPLQEMLQAAKDRGTTLTVYTAARLFTAIAAEMSVRDRNRMINITVPVNLRNFYPSYTARNFFNNIFVSHRYTGNEDIDSLIPEIREQMDQALTPENIQAHMDHYQHFQESNAIKAVPLFLKEQGLRFMNYLDEKKVTAVLSNIGAIRVPEPMKKYIDHYCVYCSSENLFVTMNSFENVMAVNFISPFRNINVIKNFVRDITAEGINVEVYASEVIR